MLGRGVAVVALWLVTGVGLGQVVIADGVKDGKAGEVPVRGATVSGRVTFADTNGPARFSKVLLKSAAPADDLFSELESQSKPQAGAKKLTAEEEAQQKQQKAASRNLLATFSDLLQAATVGADGSCVFPDVKPGTYYVHGSAKGYIDPLADFTQEELQSTDPAVRKRIAAVATVVTVVGTDGARADLRLERGGSISGRVLYDDGNPGGWMGCEDSSRSAFT